MDYACLNGLEPAGFFRWFGEVSAIPRGSCQEDKIAAFLEDFAARRNFPHETDEAKNVLIRVPASPGYENQPSFLFQAHTDMVWSKKPGVDFDFKTQPIDLQVQGDRLVANGTSLGADNAVGVATMLALADGNDPHPELELLFTAAEEVGMAGIRSFDMAKLKSRRMVNMDCGDSHVLCVTSAGSITGQIKKEYSLAPIPAGWQGWKLRLSGGKGGHAGLAANKSLACGGNLLGDLLLGMDVRLCAAAGKKAIIQSADAFIAAAPDAQAQLQARFAALKSIYQNTDPDWQLELAPAVMEHALSAQDSAHVILALSTLRTGQFRCDGNSPQVIMTSGQMRGFCLEDGHLQIDFAVRSACDAEQDLLFARYQALLKGMGMELTELSRYSGWQENPDSQLRRQFMAAHQRLFGCPMEIERVHGGIEVGIILGSIGDMDAVGIAPTARGAHTTGEYLLIDEVMPYWQLLTAVLAQKR